MATESGLGRPVVGTSVMSGVGIEELYLDGTIGGSRAVPIGGRASLGLNVQVSFTLASLVRTWGGFGGWDFASGITLPYVWEQANASFAVGQAVRSASDRASNLYDMYFTPIIAGYHFSQNDHICVELQFLGADRQLRSGRACQSEFEHLDFRAADRVDASDAERRPRIRGRDGLLVLHAQQCDQLPTRMRRSSRST